MQRRTAPAPEGLKRRKKQRRTMGHYRRAATFALVRGAGTAIGSAAVGAAIVWFSRR